MKRITLKLGNVSAVARLLEEAAPEATGKLWSMLPLEDRFSHSFRSGLMIHGRPQNRLEGDVSRYPVIENATAFLAPGDVTVFPQNGTLSVAYGTAEFKWIGGQSFLTTKVAELEGELKPFADIAGDMLYQGAQTLSISRGGEAPKAVEPELAGKKIVELEVEGETWLAELFDDEASEYAKNVWEALPLEGPATITHSSGEVLHWWVTIPDPKPAPKQRLVDVAFHGKKVGTTSVSYDPKSMRGQHPGDLVWGSTWNGIRIVFGQGRFGSQGKFGRIVKGDLDALAKRAREIPEKGSKVVRMRRYKG